VSTSRWLGVLAAMAIVGAVPRDIGAGAQPVASPAESPTDAFGAWGFDLSGQDLTVKPGDDFFRYADGAWYDRTVIAPDKTSNGIDRVLADVAEARIRDILEHGEDGVDPSARADAVKVHAFYAAFMDEARAEMLDARPIEPLLARILAATTRDDLADLMGEANWKFFDSIFGYSIEVDDKAPDRYVVSVGQGGLGLPNRDYYLEAQFAPKKAAYQAYAAQLLGMIGWDAPQQSAAAIVAFETAIAKVSWTLAEDRDSDKTYNPMTLAALERAAPFPWTRLLQSINPARIDRLIVMEVTAIPKITALYAATPIETLKAWQAFHTADAGAPMLSKRFVAANFEFHGKILGGAAENSERWKRGVHIVNGAMGEAIGRVYVARYFTPDAKARIDDLVVELRRAFQGRISRAGWMSPQTRTKALAKLAKLNAKIAYPAKWRDYTALNITADDLTADVEAASQFEWMRNVDRLNSPVDRDEWGMTPQTVNAYYDSDMNEIVFPAAQLQAPYFDPAADPAVNYGGIGAVIGHEMTHGFDDDGRKFDGDGVLKDWWTSSDVKQFKARAAVLGRQFDGYQPFPGTHVNGELTMGENIADLGGALIALDAYHASLGGKPAPAIGGLTGDQRFFLSFAQSWRTKSTEDSVRRQLVADPHAPPQFRVNGVVRNIDAWYEAFGIKAGDKLYLAPDKRVRIW
jgi:putative endopeptidase